MDTFPKAEKMGNKCTMPGCIWLRPICPGRCGPVTVPFAIRRSFPRHESNSCSSDLFAVSVIQSCCLNIPCPSQERELCNFFPLMLAHFLLEYLPLSSPPFFFSLQRERLPMCTSVCIWALTTSYEWVSIPGRRAMYQTATQAARMLSSSWQADDILIILENGSAPGMAHWKDHPMGANFGVGGVFWKYTCNQLSVDSSCYLYNPLSLFPPLTHLYRNTIRISVNNSRDYTT